jgi:cytochrome b subunit of formate dehydrogenase
MATDDAVVRYNRATRLFHAAVYLVTFLLLGTGWWLRTGHEGRPSVAARILDTPDTEVHRRAGWVLTVLFGLGLTLGVRAAYRFVRETVRVNRSDWRWFVRWPIGALTGRFAAHRGRFDPGQRIANIGFVVTFGALLVSGIGLTTVHGGPSFVWMVRVHRYATYGLTALVSVHLVMALGLLPGYRGVWRGMHLGGRTPKATARRLWPATVPHEDDVAPRSPGESITRGAGPGRPRWPRRAARARGARPRRVRASR